MPKQSRRRLVDKPAPSGPTSPLPWLAVSERVPVPPREHQLRQAERRKNGLRITALTINRKMSSFGDNYQTVFFRPVTDADIHRFPREWYFELRKAMDNAQNAYEKQVTQLMNENGCTSEKARNLMQSRLVNGLFLPSRGPARLEGPNEDYLFAYHPAQKKVYMTRLRRFSPFASRPTKPAPNQ